MNNYFNIIKRYFKRAGASNGPAFLMVRQTWHVVSFDAISSVMVAVG
jgi:hypothetical protein